MSQRSPVAVFFLTFFTGGVYGLYWLIKTPLELREAGAEEAPSPLWILAWPLVVPIFLYYYWIYLGIQEITADDSPPAGSFVLLFFPPALLAYWQSCINSVAG